MGRPNNDEEYKEGTQRIVDDAMRTDVLGPKIVQIIEEHRPVYGALKTVITDLVKNDVSVKTELEDCYGEFSNKWKIRGMNWLIGIIGGAIGAVIIAAIVHYAKF